MKIEEILNIVEKGRSAFFYTPRRFDDAKSYLFTKVYREVVITEFDRIDDALLQVDKYIEVGLIGYGFFTYEAGYFFEERLKKIYNHKPVQPYLYLVFCRQEDVLELKSSDVDFSGAAELLQKPDYSIENLHLNISKEKYINDIEKIKEAIKEGDTYQVNYTLKNKFNFNGNKSSLFLNLIFNQSAAYTAFINTGGKSIISISPELFFRVENNEITTVPMKGTIKRGENLGKDALQFDRLKNSSKDKAENIMIVDLLRNDLGKISKIDSVKPQNIFDIETYETVFQMVSTVKSEMLNNKFSNVIRSIFPCGSITGAPKIRTMRIINQLETEPRGVYTGAIGLVKKNNFVFNVSIRTLEIDNVAGDAEMGIGGGVVWDSNPEDEYNEAILKSRFLTNPDPYFEIIESFLIEYGKIFLAEYHLARIKKASQYFLFQFDERKYLNTVDNILNRIDSNKKYKGRIQLDKWGNFNSDFSEIGENPEEISINISNLRTNPGNKFLYYKTTNRVLYSSAIASFAASNYFDQIFFNEKEELCEGARCNIIIEKNGQLYTPAYQCGLLNGTYRQYLIDNKKCIEKVLYKDDLLEADAVYLTNSVRKMVKVNSIFEDAKFLKTHIL